jgi:hypothetical protein
MESRCSMHGKAKKCKKTIWSEDFKQRNPTEDQDTGDRIGCKKVDWIHLTHNSPVVGSCEHSKNRPSTEHFGKPLQCHHTRARVRTHARTHAHARTRAHTHTHTCMHAYTHTYPHPYMQAHMRVRTHTHTHTHTHAYVHVYTHVYIHIHIHIHAHMHTHSIGSKVSHNDNKFLLLKIISKYYY